MKLQGKKIAILAENYYEDMELWYPFYRMKEEGAEISIVGTGTGETYTSKHGYPVKVDKTADKVKAEDFNAVIIPGGYAPDHMRRSQAMVNLVTEAHTQGKVVAAICHAGWMLASAGIVKGKTVTCFHSIKDDLVNAGAEYVDEEVVIDGNLVTSRTPKDLPVFCRAIIDLLTK